MKTGSVLDPGPYPSRMRIYIEFLGRIGSAPHIPNTDLYHCFPSSLILFKALNPIKLQQSKETNNNIKSLITSKQTELVSKKKLSDLVGETQVGPEGD